MTGECKFCNQIVMVDDGTAPDMVAHEATMHCKCDGSILYQEHHKRAAMAKRHIESMFQDVPSFSKCLQSMVDIVNSGEVVNASFTIGDSEEGFKATISKLPNEGIRIKRTDTETMTKEC